MPYSVSKPFAALSCLVLVERGLLDVDAPVSQYWPAFASAGKGECTVRQLLEHQAGIPFVPAGCTLEDMYSFTAMADKIAAQEPVWPPGQRTAEHAILYGHLCATLVESISGETFRSFFTREIQQRLGLELYFGVPDERLERCAELSPWPAEVVEELRGLTPLAEAGLFVPDVLCRAEVVNSRPWRQAAIPAVNLHCSARDVAQVYGMLASDSGNLLSAPTLSLLRLPGEPQKDEVFGFEARWSLGFQHHLWESNNGAKNIGTRFGLGGIGGSSAFGSFEHELGFAYVTRQMGDWQRAEAVEEALLQSLVSLSES